jgi:hypothetical protein
MAGEGDPEEIARKELGGEKKISWVIWTDSETVIKGTTSEHLSILLHV